MYHAWISSRDVDFSSESQVLDSLTAQWEIETEPSESMAAYIPAEKNTAIKFFQFDPNNATKEELKALGFSDRLSKGLINYRTKGGEFRIKSDLKKLYGMDSTFFHQLSPFIQLPERIVFAKTVPEPKKDQGPFNLNDADTVQFQTVYGVGQVLARRIVKYRERLGGFVRNEQLFEVYGLDSAVIGQITKKSFLAENDSLRKLNINTVDEKTLSSHPYFSKKIASAIVTYRFQHGKYRAVADLRAISILDEKTMTKIYPYLTVD